jgi:hypothetical protein
MPRNPNKRHCTVPGCNAWAMRDSEPPRCSPHSGKVGAPEDNQNRLTHGFYSTAVHPEELADLASHACDATLLAEIAITRIALRRIFGMLVTGQTPAPNSRPLEARDYARFVGLAFRGPAPSRAFCAPTMPWAATCPVSSSGPWTPPSIRSAPSGASNCEGLVLKMAGPGKSGSWKGLAERAPIVCPPPRPVSRCPVLKLGKKIPMTWDRERRPGRHMREPKFLT